MTTNIHDILILASTLIDFYRPRLAGYSRVTANIGRVSAARSCSSMVSFGHCGSSVTTIPIGQEGPE